MEEADSLLQITQHVPCWLYVYHYTQNSPEEKKEKLRDVILSLNILRH